MTNQQPSQKTAAIVSGYWCTNIGNAFFNKGAEYILKKILGEDNVHLVFDSPAYISSFARIKESPKNALNYVEHLDVDYLVLLGPVLSASFLHIWKETLDALAKKGTKYLILSAGMMKHNANIISEIKSYFRANPPHAITTRDEDTYDEFKDCGCPIYNGICFAFFVPEAIHRVPASFSPYIALNFDKIDEPVINVNKVHSKSDMEFTFENDDFSLRFTSLTSRICLKTDRMTDALIYLSSLLPHKTRPTKLGKYDIIRTDHRFSPMVKRKVYKYANSFCSDLPETYANLYAGARLTLSDRVHACAIALAYGNHAFLFAKTNRSALLERVGAAQITTQPTCIDLENLRNEKEKLLNWLTSQLT